MAGKSTAIKFKEPKNPLDPIVVFDPKFDFSNIVLPLPDLNAGRPNRTDVNVDTLSLMAIERPLVKLNNRVLVNDNIYSLILTSKNFLPEIEIVINDENGHIQATDVPGMNNVITVIMIAPVDGANKKISLDFYITNCKFNDDNTVTYIGEFKSNGLKQVKYSQIGDSALTTYEMLENIAKELKLGFATSEKCKDIDDKRWRQIYSQTYKEYILHEIDHSGLDEESIFDTWVDIFGYLVMVNVHHILTEKCDLEQLSTKVITGSVTAFNEDNMKKQQVEEIYRMITNSHDYNGVANLHISEYHSVVNNNDIMNNGTSNKYYYLTEPCDTNTISQEEVQIVENSVDGNEEQDSYKFENIQFIGVCQEDSEDECKTIKIVQEQIVKNYFNKIYSKLLVVTMDIPNYSLQRGMLVGVIIEEYNANNKQSIAENGSNASATSEDENTNAQINDSSSRNILIDDRMGLMNPGLSGIYYIKEVGLNYNSGMNQIIQTLTLVKKGLLSNIQNKYTAHKSVK